MAELRVLLLSRYDRRGANSRVRLFQYVPYLEADGIRVTIAPLLGDDYVEGLYAGRGPRWRVIFGAYLRRLRDLLAIRRFDLLWIESEILPWLPAWAEALVSRLGVPYVVDYDDAVFHRYDRHPRLVVRAVLGGKIDAVMRRAALVVVGNEYLADRARQAGARRVEYLPSVVDLEAYRATPRADERMCTIGWIGTPATAHYLRAVHPALAEVCRTGTARVVLVGAGDVGLGDVPVATRAWSERTEAADVEGFDVGIMPLPDSPWERGKCGYKLIQYMACGRPVVASPVGVNRHIVEHGVNGFLATTAEEWVRALGLLCDSHELRESMGRAGRTKVEARYCLQVTAPRCVALLRSVVASL